MSTLFSGVCTLVHQEAHQVVPNETAYYNRIRSKRVEVRHADGN